MILAVEKSLIVIVVEGDSDSVVIVIVIVTVVEGYSGGSLRVIVVMVE